MFLCAVVLAEEVLIALEWSAVVLNIGFTLALTYGRRWGWVLGFFAGSIGVLLYALKHTWAMSVLNGYYVVMAVYGWWSWGRSEEDGGFARKPWPVHAGIVPAGTLLVVLMAWTLGRYLDGTFPQLDAFVTVFSFAATWMMARKWVENWLYFIVADAVAVYFNWRIGYNAYALLNIVYLGLSAAGYVRWSRAYARQSSDPIKEPGAYPGAPPRS